MCDREFIVGADKLRAAERMAKESRIRLWKDWQSTGPQITGKEKEFTGTVMEIINGDALVIKLNNGQLKKVFLASIRPPKEPGRYVKYIYINLNEICSYIM